MILSKNKGVFTLLLGDLALFYVSLFWALFFRYLGNITFSAWDIHQLPFLFIHIVWLLVFYASEMYDTSIFPSLKKTSEKVLKTMAVATVVATLIFYLNLAPGVEITPKTNLFIDAGILTVLLILWRRFFWKLNKNASKTNAMFLGESKEVDEIIEKLKINPHLGYFPSVVLSNFSKNLKKIIKEKNIHLVVASKKFLEDQEYSKKLYEVIPLGVSIINLPNFYEMLSEKIPISRISEAWFLENLLEINKKTFEMTKRLSDILMAFVLFVPSLVLLPFVSVLIKATSPGPIFYKQKRVGKNGKIFEVIKFRSMKKDAEKNGAVWAKKEDPRITKFGNFLRKSRIDELPQIINVLKGEMSFIGPRPERPEFVNELKKEIPFYSIRHIIKPGLSGWAQVKFPYGASVKDAMEKLQYDLFYIKNRSFILDLAITAKTLAIVLSQKGR